MSREPSRRNRWPAALDAVTATLLVLSLGLIIGGVAWPRGEAPAEKAEEAEFAEGSASTPTRLFIPAIKVNNPIVPIHNDANRVLQIPPDPEVMGWWEPSAKPGATRGQTLITAHTDHDDPAPLNRLPELKKGKPIDIVTADGRMRYQVTHSKIFSREAVAQHAEELFGQNTDAKGRLLIVSCANWNGVDWEDNIIVFAKPIGTPLKALEKQRENQAKTGADEDDDTDSPLAAPAL